MSDDLNPISAMFSVPGAAIFGVMTEALAKADQSGCECETCTLLRAALGAMDAVARGNSE